MPLLTNFYYCSDCRAKISPASEQVAHEAWHKERDRKPGKGEWQVGTNKGNYGRIKGKGSGKPRSGALKKEGISIKRVNEALGE